MSVETLLWIKVAHIFGIMMWVGTMFGLYQMLFAYGTADQAGRKTLLPLIRKVAIAMDVGATITIAAGVAFLFGIKPSPLKAGGWMHIKLALIVVGMLGAHVYARITIKKLRNGGDKTPPEVLFPVLNLIVIGILIMAIVKPFAK